MPTLACPFPSRLHPDVAAIQADSVDWAQHMGLVDGHRAMGRLEASAIGHLTSRAFPAGPLPVLKLATRWITLFCLLDDLVEDPNASPLTTASTLAGLLRALQTGESSLDHVATAAYLDLHASIAAIAPPDWRVRFVREVEAIHATFVWESLHRASRVRPDAITYARMREVTAGLLAAFCFHELVDPAFSAPLLSDPEIDALRRDASRIVGYANDIYTWERELAAGELHNLVLLHAFRDGLPLPAAVAVAVDLHDRAVALLAARTERLVEGDDVGAARYGAMLRAWVGGHDAWGRATGRYRATVTPPIEEAALACK